MSLQLWDVLERFAALEDVNATILVNDAGPTLCIESGEDAVRLREVGLARQLAVFDEEDKPVPPKPIVAEWIRNVLGVETQKSSNLLLLRI